MKSPKCCEVVTMLTKHPCIPCRTVVTFRLRSLLRSKEPRFQPNGESVTIWIQRPAVDVTVCFPSWERFKASPLLWGWFPVPKPGWSPPHLPFLISERPNMTEFLVYFRSDNSVLFASTPRIPHQWKIFTFFAVDRSSESRGINFRESYWRCVNLSV